jgi:hypothetical protein
VLVAPYGALAFDRIYAALPKARPALVALVVASVVPPLFWVASVDATLLADPRHQVERMLDALPDGTRVEVYGGPIFMPRVPRRLGAVRPGVEPIMDREAIAGVVDVVDPAMDPRPRAPDVIVLATELSSLDVARASDQHPFGLMQYGDAVSHAFLAKLFDGSLGYVRTLRATCTLPWPLECATIHHSTGGEAWVYARAR